jgi:hypothetical protein
MKLNHYLDGGTAQVFQEFETGQEIYQAFTEGVAAYAYPRGTRLRQWTVKGVFLSNDLSGYQTPSMGLFPRGSFRANKLRAKQFEEFVGNRENMACYIEWFAGGNIESEDQPDDGWYIITKFHTNKTMAFFGIIEWEMEVVYVSPGNQRGHKLWWRGGALTSTFPYAGDWSLATPLDATTPLASIVVHSFEGDINLIPKPNLASSPFAFNTTTPNLLKGGVHTFDTTIDSTRPNATPPTTTLSHAPTWVEAFGADHRFLGDIVVTNGVLMCVIPVTTQPQKLMDVYWWDSIETLWRKAGSLAWNDNTRTRGNLLSATLRKTGPEKAEVRMIAYTSTAEAEVVFKLERGRRFGRVDLRPLTLDNTSEYALEWIPVSAGWHTFNSTLNSSAAASNLAVDIYFGFAGFYYADAAQEWSAGFLYQNPPSTHMPIWTTAGIGFGDTGQKVDTVTSYGFFVTPDDDTELDVPDNTNASKSGPGDLSREFLQVNTVRVALG